MAAQVTKLVMHCAIGRRGGCNL